MPWFETQGLSDDFQHANGSYDLVKRATLNRPKVREVLNALITLRPKSDEDCPPTLIVISDDDPDDYYVFCDNGLGKICCPNTGLDNLTLRETEDLIYGDLDFKRVRQEKGENQTGAKIVFFLLLLGLIAVAISMAITL